MKSYLIETVRRETRVFEKDGDKLTLVETLPHVRSVHSLELPVEGASQTEGANAGSGKEPSAKAQAGGSDKPK